jgi:hypothetical protein
MLEEIQYQTAATNGNSISQFVLLGHVFSTNNALETTALNTGKQLKIRLQLKRLFQLFLGGTTTEKIRFKL